MSNPKGLILAMPGNEAQAAALAAFANADWAAVETRRFPDGESYVRLPVGVKGRTVDILCTLNNPDGKTVPLVLAAGAARDGGAARVGLIAPYLAYMRQDKSFHEGEAVSARYYAQLISGAFDRLVTVDPHLHRIKRLDEVYTIPSVCLDAAPLLGAWIAEHVEAPLIVGPDAESRQWASRVAETANAPFVVLEKTRLGDRKVEIAAPDLASFAGRRPVLIDDIAASGRTLIMAAAVVTEAGLPNPDCVVVHDLMSVEDSAAVRAAVSRLVSTDSAPGPSNAIALARLLASPSSVLPL